MSSRGRTNRSAWDADPRNKRILEDRWGSDSEYDPRRPRNRHPQNQPKPSHFGPNFQNIEKNRSESFTNRIEPKMPKPYAPRPTDWSEDPRIKRDYNRYKAPIMECKVASDEYGALDPRGVGRRTEPAKREPRLRDGLIANTKRRTAANKVAAGRVGFDHKYPWAYPSLKSKDSHANGSEVNSYKTIARDAAVSHGEIKGKIHKWL